ncbi:hypothetical protein HYALB_00014040 [Hymenoscyphus albidus]|uniref:Uncharacterized protein n=1 Tax=Hymenoscyphus albidus TaxID=595503 RepID=A0A9N9LYI3_9HELO|nr:hypothetical protein HYALB_00014040 [Hymenoscyphus albidus]
MAGPGLKESCNTAWGLSELKMDLLRRREVKCLEKRKGKRTVFLENVSHSCTTGKELENTFGTGTSQRAGEECAGRARRTGPRMCNKALFLLEHNFRLLKEATYRDEHDRVKHFVLT